MNSDQTRVQIAHMIDRALKGLEVTVTGLADDTRQSVRELAAVRARLDVVSIRLKTLEKMQDKWVDRVLAFEKETALAATERAVLQRAVASHDRNWGQTAGLAMAVLISLISLAMNLLVK